ncbi:MAG: hypothetical protein PHX62_04370 [Bacilli bacterium]|nr:hypothetical protein [Bacilli bacterium]
MSKHVFLYKEQGTDDRDCVKYIDISRIGKLECGHYFHSIGITGACFSCSLKLKEIDLSNITTILTQEEFEQLDNYNEAINELGYGIKEDDERYLKGTKLYKNILPIFEKLESRQNTTLFEQIQEEEREFLKEEYSLEDEDIDYIFDNYGLNYRDRGIISVVFNNIEEAAQEEAESLGYVTKENERYFDYEKFGEDLLEGEQYLELSNGSIVYLNY